MTSLIWRWRRHPVLYDLEADPNETCPLSNSNTTKVIAMMKGKIDEVLATLDNRCSKLSSHKWMKDEEVLRRLKDLGYA